MVSDLLEIAKTRRLRHETYSVGSCGSRRGDDADGDQRLTCPGSNDDGWSVLWFLDLGLVLVVERAMVVLGVAQDVLGFDGVVDTMG